MVYLHFQILFANEMHLRKQRGDTQQRPAHQGFLVGFPPPPHHLSISLSVLLLVPNHVRLGNEKADSTLRSSQAVPHPSTDRALRCLTSEVKRDPVHSARYGRRRRIFKFAYY